MKLLFKVLGFVVDDDSPIGKMISGFSILTFFSSGLSIVLLVLATLVIFLIPAIFLGASSSDDATREYSSDLINLYGEVVAIDLVNQNDAYIENIRSGVSYDEIVINDYTFITPEMLIAFDSVYFEQDIALINRNHVLEVLNKMVSRTHDVSHAESSVEFSSLVTLPNGSMIDFDNNRTLLEVLEEKHPDGTKQTVGNMIYYRYSEVQTRTIITVTFSSISFESLLDLYGFDEIQRSLAYGYLNFSVQSMVSYSGVTGNFKILSDSTRFVLPIEISYPLASEMFVNVTSGFGYREFVYKGRLVKGLHNGIDFGLPVGTPIVASDSGIVSYVGVDGDYGLWINVIHSGGFISRYAHLSLSTVSVGQSVSKGERIALSGNSGRSTGAHLHFEIRSNNVPVDPLPFLNLSILDSN